MIEAEVKSLALREGAIRAGIARHEAFAEAPPSGDMGYVTPWARAVVAFALPLGTDWIQDYFGKVTRMAFKKSCMTSTTKHFRSEAPSRPIYRRPGLKP